MTEGPRATSLPDDDLEGARVTPDPSTRSIQDGRVLIGGSPLRLVRLTEAGRRLVDRLTQGDPVPSGPTATTLTRRLLDGGLVHPERPEAPFTAGDVTIVVPVRGRLAPDLADVLTTASATTRVIVVDDGGVVPLASPGGNVEIVRHEKNRGPGEARNSGLTMTTTPITAFLDADCVPAHDWLDGLLGHFADPLVAAVAPRIVAPEETTTSAVGRYETVRSPLDLGPTPARVRARTRVSHVPSAALVVRTGVVRDLGGFDATMRVGEDVDLAWRLDEAGWTIRYEPTVEVTHLHRTRVGQWARRRFDYGTSAGPLAVRHPGALAPVEASPWSIAVWGLLMTGHPIAAGIAAGTTVDLLARGLASLDHPFPVAARLAAQGHLSAGRLLADAIVRTWWPVALGAAALSPRARRIVVSAVVLPALWEWTRHRPPLDPARWLLLRVVDQVAYGTGVWVGAVRARTPDPLLPEITSWPRPSRYSRWRTGLSRR